METKPSSVDGEKEEQKSSGFSPEFKRVELGKDGTIVRKQATHQYVSALDVLSKPWGISSGDTNEQEFCSGTFYCSLDATYNSDGTCAECGKKKRSVDTNIEELKNQRDEYRERYECNQYTVLNQNQRIKDLELKLEEYTTTRPVQEKPDLKSDDSDIRKSWLSVSLGGNGDYYLSIRETKHNGLDEVNVVRVSTSGGNAPLEVKVAVADLFRAMEKHGLAELPSNTENVLSIVQQYEAGMSEYFRMSDYRSMYGLWEQFINHVKNGTSGKTT